MKHPSLMIFIVVLLAGCQLINHPYPRDAEGNVVLSEKQAQALLSNNQLVIDKAKTAVKLTDKERKLVEENPEALFSFAGQADEDEQVVALIRQGSLHANARRIADENDWQQVIFDLSDQLVEQPFIIEGQDLPISLITLYDYADAYTCIDEDEKVITVIPNEPSKDSIIETQSINEE